MRRFIYVYGELGDNLVKVGVTAQLNKRFHSLRTATRRRDAGYLFILPYDGYGPKGIERKAHRFLSAYRIDKRGEWFLTTAQVAAQAVIDAEREWSYWHSPARLASEAAADAA